MSNINVKIMRVSKLVTLPTFGSTSAAGADLYACLERSVTVRPGQTVKIPLGFATAFDSDHVGLIFARSGTAIKHGCAPANKVGVIDADYRGEWVVALLNHGAEEKVIGPGDRIAQVVFVERYEPQFELCDDLPDTERGAGGFGSTGK